jgi:hypothetical protein
MNKHNESLRDFRRYLCSDPVPSDFKEVQKELDEMIDMKSKAETKPAAAPSSSSGSTARPTSATGNPNLRSSRDSKFNSNFNPFNRPDGPADDSSRPNSARSTSDWEQKGKVSKTYIENSEVYANLVMYIKDIFGWKLWILCPQQHLCGIFTTVKSSATAIPSTATAAATTISLSNSVIQ